MINIDVIASGSSGNCYKIDNGKHSLLIECGIRFGAIQKALNFKLTALSGCLVSHCHADHSMSSKSMTDAGINLYMSAGTAEKLDLAGHRVKIIKSEKQFAVDSFKIMPFETQHDAPEPLGFLISDKLSMDKLVFITDSYYCKYVFKDLTHIMVECNYKIEFLNENIASGKVNPGMRKRIVNSHFELENVKRFLKANKSERLRQINLVHISNENGDPKLFVKEIQGLFGVPVYAH